MLCICCVLLNISVKTICRSGHTWCTMSPADAFGVCFYRMRHSRIICSACFNERETVPETEISEARSVVGVTSIVQNIQPSLQVKPANTTLTCRGAESTEATQHCSIKNIFKYVIHQKGVRKCSVVWCILPRSLIRGSTLVVKFVYEAIFPSGEAMPTWASYILKLLGFLGRG